MNEISTHPKPEARVVAPETDRRPEPKAVPRRPGAVQDSARLQEALASGRNPLATRRDLVELNKRLVETIATLGKGLSEQSAEKAAADRRQLSERLEEMRDEVNAMEGLLRIELAPQFRMMLNESLDEHLSRKGRGWRAVAWSAAMIAAGIAIGTAFSTEIGDLAASARVAVETWL